MVRLTRPLRLAERWQVDRSQFRSTLTQKEMVPVGYLPARAPDAVPNRQKCPVGRPSLSSLGQTLNEIAYRFYPRFRPFLGRETNVGKYGLSHGVTRQITTRYGKHP